MQKAVYEFISRSTNDPILEWRTCPRTGEEFAIFQGDKDLLHKISPTIGGMKYEYDLPTLSPESRMRRRLMFRNERGLYKRTSEISGKLIISMYHEESGHKVISSSEHTSDQYNPLQYAREYDSNKSFVDQYKELFNTVTKVGVIVLNNENGEYNNYAWGSKNIYWCMDVMSSENVCYSTTIKNIKNGYDLFTVHDSELVYNCISSRTLQKCVYTRYGENCHSCGFSYTITNCTNCRFCQNIQNKQNYLFNKPASKEEIEAIKQGLKNHKTLEEYKNKFAQMMARGIRPGDWKVNCEASIGSNLRNCKNVLLGWDSSETEDSRYVLVSEHNKNCMDTSIFNPEAENCLEQVCGGHQVKNSFCCTVCRESSNIYWGNYMLAANHMFGCVNMHHKDRCILNKQYDKEQRQKIVPNIINDLKKNNLRGEFFPTTLCPYPYNDSVAMDYLPVHTAIYPDGTKKIIDPDGFGDVYIQQPEKFISSALLDLGGKEKVNILRRTRDNDVTIPAGAETIYAKDLPDSIDDVDDSILKKVILCEKTGRPFRIVGNELAFYRKMGLALPRKHHDIRHQERFKSRPAKRFYLRNCDKLGTPFLSLYPEGVSFPNYCQEAYMKEVYG